MRSLLFAPHNDDETLFTSFLIQRERPLVIVCYRSVLQEGQGIKAFEREQETKDAMLALVDDGVFVQWQYPDDDTTTDDEIEANMWGLLDPVSDDVPDTVYVPFEHRRSHPQHNQVSRVAKRVFHSSTVVEYLTYDFPGGPKQTRGSQVEPDADMIVRKLQALSCYGSQIEAGPRRMWLEWDIREYVR